MTCFTVLQFKILLKKIQISLFLVIRFLLLVNSGRQLSSTQMLTSSQWYRNKLRKVKVRKLLSQDKDSLMHKAKVVHTRKAKQQIQALLDWQTSLANQELLKQHFFFISASWEDKHHHSQCPYFLLLSSNVFKISLWLSWLSSPGRVLSQLTVHSQPPYFSRNARSKKDLFKHCSATNETLLSQVCNYAQYLQI